MENSALMAAMLAGAAVLLPMLSQFMPRRKEQLHDLFCRTGLRWSSEEERGALAARLAQAGLRWKPEWFAGFRLCLLGGYFLAGLFLLIAGVDFFWVLLFAPVFYLGPNLWLNARVNVRKSAIRLALSDFIVLFYTAVAAGADVSLALREAAAGVGGPLAEEVERTLSEYAVGRPMVDALTAMAERCDVNELRALVRAIVQSYRYGSPLVEAMRGYSGQMRLVRRFEMMEVANRLPVQLIFPVLLFILAPMMLILMYPAVVSLLEVLGS